MRTFAGRILSMMGWKINGEFPDIDKSVTIFAPHTAHVDAFYGKLAFAEIGINYTFLTKKEMFFFPMNYIMKWFGSIPVRGVKGQNAIYHVAKLLEEADNLHIVMAPEGWIKKVYKWNSGFYHMAKKADVPIVVTYLDYAKKEVGVCGVITDLSDYDSVIGQVNGMLKGVKGKNPENFILEAIEERDKQQTTE